MAKGINAMSKLTTKERKKLPAKVFGLKKEKKYPMQDKPHAANAKARAAQMVKKGKLSKSQEKRIDAQANKVLHKSKKMSHVEAHRIDERGRRTVRGG